MECSSTVKLAADACNSERIETFEYLIDRIYTFHPLKVVSKVDFVSFGRIELAKGVC